jgi:hypothetical protein
MILKDDNKQVVLVKDEDLLRGLEISCWQFEDESKEYYMKPVVYTYDRTSKFGLFSKIYSRIQAAIHILRFGQFEATEIVMNEDSFQEFLDALIDMEKAQ